MLDVAYEAVNDLPPGRLATIDEDRGRIRVRLDESEPLERVVHQLNIEIDRLMSAAHWFQLWGDEIVSRATPGCPLRIRYVLKDWDADEAFVAEDRGVVSVYFSQKLTTKQFAVAMNKATDQLLSGGRWFQLYAGEIIDNSPESMRQR
ncbi:hypothetical protein ACFW2V_03055 [Streptomyces sp. NPDC058947]|uniref:hypothetical protein n=1 Tax=Streptomyces sp. NPDC058947 TaxID=3346675 RepID=UPI00369D8EE2